MANGTLKRVLAFPTLNAVQSYKGRLSHILHDLSFWEECCLVLFLFQVFFFFSAFCLVWVVPKLWRKSSGDSWLSFSRCHGSYAPTEAPTTGRPGSVHLLTDPTAGIWVLLKREPIVWMEIVCITFPLSLKIDFFHATYCDYGFPSPNSIQLLLIYPNPLSFFLSLITFLKTRVLDKCLFPALPSKQDMAITGAKR